MAKRASDAAKVLRAYGLTFPGAHTKSPWPGHLDLAVNDKTFAYLSGDGEPFSIGCKLPTSSSIALMLPFAQPTPYGLGKSGWVTAQIAAGDDVPVELFKSWIVESYRAQAPKKLLKEFDGGGPAAPASSRKAPATRRPIATRATAKSGTKAKAKRA
jgi:predicted DNA-binding protein (MmcQ/YjbR family)